MNELKVGESVYIKSYKHNGSLHRTWSKALVIDITDEYLVVVTDRSLILESDGRNWITKEPAICFFYFNRWFNIISMARKNGVYFYCNLASPSLIDEEGIKNIDYDLDIKVHPDYSYTILDEHEYAMHSKTMNYSKEIMDIIENEMQELIKMIENKEKPFNFNLIEKYLMKYFKMTINSQ